MFLSVVVGGRLLAFERSPISGETLRREIDGVTGHP